MKCTHPEHVENTDCSDRAVACAETCICCKPLISLFTDSEFYSPLAGQIDQEIRDVIEPILYKWAKAVKTRELEYLAHTTVTEICLEILLLRKVN
jgi:hypothetical protein